MPLSKSMASVFLSITLRGTYFRERMFTIGQLSWTKLHSKLSSKILPPFCPVWWANLHFATNVCIHMQWAEVLEWNRWYKAIMNHVNQDHNLIPEMLLNILWATIKANKKHCTDNRNNNAPGTLLNPHLYLSSAFTLLSTEPGRWRFLICTLR